MFKDFTFSKGNALLQLTHTAPSGRLVHSTTRFVPTIVEHVIPRESLPTVAKSFSAEAATFGNFDVFIRGRDDGRRGYRMETTIDVSENGSMVSLATAQHFLNNLSGYFRTQAPAQTQFMYPSIVGEGGPELPRPSYLGNLIRGVSSLLAYTVDVSFWMLWLALDAPRRWAVGGGR